MSAVTVALLVGFVCCALVIRALGERGAARGPRAVVVETDDRAGWRGTETGRSNA
ncbi:hypothetical protein [Nocardia tenerifensis]|nr:hypothetical protein [Nocardia tenerifensis]